MLISNKSRYRLFIHKHMSYIYTFIHQSVVWGAYEKILTYPHIYMYNCTVYFCLKSTWNWVTNTILTRGSHLLVLSILTLNRETLPLHHSAASLHTAGRGRSPKIKSIHPSVKLSSFVSVTWMMHCCRNRTLFMASPLSYFYTFHICFRPSSLLGAVGRRWFLSHLLSEQKTCWSSDYFVKLWCLPTERRLEEHM